MQLDAEKIEKIWEQLLKNVGVSLLRRHHVNCAHCNTPALHLPCSGVQFQAFHFWGISQRTFPDNSRNFRNVFNIKWKILKITLDTIITVLIKTKFMKTKKKTIAKIFFRKFSIYITNAAHLFYDDHKLLNVSTKPTATDRISQY